MNKIILLLSSITLIIFSPVYAQCTSSGSHNGSSFASAFIPGTVSWVTPTNAVTSNGIASMATINVSANTTVNTDILYVRNFNFSIPSNAAICGISVKLEKMQNGAISGSSSVVDHTVQLTKNGTFVGNNLAFAWPWTNYYSNIVYGGSGQSWGYSWTPADINSPDFGVGIRASIQNSSSASTISTLMDHVAITVFYTLPLPVEWGPVNCVSANNKPLIRWSTLSESNSFQFVIQKSSDAIQWVSIDSVLAAGNSTQPNYYECTDKHPSSGYTYYRIAQIDLNGNKNYSDVVTHYFEVENNDGISINYQNGTITVTSNATGILNLQCIGLFGNTLMQKDVLIQGNIPIPGISFNYAGPFVVICSIKGEYTSVKFMGYP